MRTDRPVVVTVHWGWRTVRPVKRLKAKGSAVLSETVWRDRQSGGDGGRKNQATIGQARVENTFFRYKSIIGDDLRARTPGGQEAEMLLACNVLNRTTELGRPMSYSIGR